MNATWRGDPREAGTTSVEFSLTALIFFLLVMGVVEFGRVVFTWNAAAEATRAGARIASVSPMGSPRVEESMRAILADLQASQIALDYQPAGCNPDNCVVITVSIVDYKVTPLLLPIGVLPVPNASTTVQRESLGVI